MWRPPDWKNQFNPAAIEVRDRDWKLVSHHDAYEAGADAILGALKENGEYNPPLKITGDNNWSVELPGGWSIFIPDEIEDGKDWISEQ